ncbi:hypothetical protein DFH07DRAFT_767407 [Mycena maculata]|uniref:Uncharacterized protein n=1 Tax=Mycena maculata TaxID=230809 RepID=A0AAD7JY15_9AGAR|nr:hypothetical protein DFH07DRAFT_767407 [Mycena maculata]
MEDSLMDDSNLPPDTQMLTETAESAITAMVSMDVDAKEKLDFGGGSLTSTLDEPVGLVEPEDLFPALTPNTEDNAGPDSSGSTETGPEDLETDELPDQYTGDVMRKQVRVLQMELAVSEGRLKDARTDLAEERRCTGRNIAETAVLRDEVKCLKNELDRVYNERDDTRDRAVRLHADLKEAESAIDQLDRLRSYGDSGRDRKRSQAEVHLLPEGSGKARRIDAATVEGIDPVDEDMAMPPMDDTTPAAGRIVHGIEAHDREIARLQAQLPPPLGFTRTVKLLRIVRPPPGWEAHRWDRHGLPTDIRTWTSMFEVHKHQHGAPGASHTDVQKHALEHYWLYDWVSKLLTAVGGDHGALKNGAAIEQYKECSPNVVRNYDPHRVRSGYTVSTETNSSSQIYGRLLDTIVLSSPQRQLQASAMGSMGWYAGRLAMLGITVTYATQLSQWLWSDNLALVTEREFIQQMADMGVGITLMESGCNYARELLFCIMHGEVPPKTSLADWTVEEATDVFDRARITGSPIHEEPEETDILLRKPRLPYETSVLTKPAFHMYEWMHPDIRGIPRKEGSRIQALIDANRHHPPSNYHAQQRVVVVNPFLTAAQREAAKQDAMNSRHVVAPVQGPAYAPARASTSFSDISWGVIITRTAAQ